MKGTKLLLYVLEAGKSEKESFFNLSVDNFLPRFI